MIIKNLENKIKLAGILSIGCFATSIVISGMAFRSQYTETKKEYSNREQNHSGTHFIKD